MNDKALLIAMCGPDGSGKSTTSQFIHVMLQDAGIPNIVVQPLVPDRLFVKGLHELKQELETSQKSTAELEKFIADYFSYKLLHAIRSTVLPAIEQGRTVICDRYIYSHFVNQSVFGVDVERSDLWDLVPKPDITFYFDVPVQTALERVSSRGEKGVGDNSWFLSKAKEKFEELAIREGFVRLDATETQDTVCNKIMSTIQQRSEG